MIRTKKLHRAEIEVAKDAENAMKSKLQESETTCQSVQKTLAALISEKEELKKELAEVTAISEEFASMFEQQQQQQPTVATD